jgi:hypothetical protein
MSLQGQGKPAILVRKARRARFFNPAMEFS